VEEVESYGDEMRDLDISQKLDLVSLPSDEDSGSDD
jgi:hypothetical protein